MPDVTYPLDTTGLSPDNLIKNEPHTLTEINSNTYNIIIPKFAPFYTDNFKLINIGDDGTITELQEGYHYNLALMYLGGTRSIGKALYGGISILDNLVNGYIELEYQTLGGNWTADRQLVLTRLAEMAYNPRVTVWDVVTNIQEIFPPINHDNNMDYVYGHGDLINKLNEIVTAILAAGTNSIPLIQQLIDNIKTDKASLGLDKLSNLPLATDIEVRNKEPLAKYFTLEQLVNEILPNLNNTNTVVFSEMVSDYVLDETDMALYRSVKYTVQISGSPGYQVSELQALHNNTDVYIAETSNIDTGNRLVSFSAEVFENHIHLLVSSYFSGLTIKIVKSVIEI